MGAVDLSGVIRLDVALIARGLAKSRQAAKQRIISGEIMLNGRVVNKASVMVSSSDKLICTGDAPRYVGRGGLKLEKALDIGKYMLDGRCALDVGASTGGFTDCLLQHGAQKVYAVDVGHGQLDKKLACDRRVVNLEATDIRDTDRITKYIQPASISFCSIDVSFISVTLIFDSIMKLLKPNADIVCLIKPQFEAGHDAVGKNGLVKDTKAHFGVLTKLCEYFIEHECGLKQLDYSPVKGGSGNTEYLALLQAGCQGIVPNVAHVISQAQNALKGR